MLYFRIDSFLTLPHHTVIVFRRIQQQPKNQQLIEPLLQPKDQQLVQPILQQVNNLNKSIQSYLLCVEGDPLPNHYLVEMILLKVVWVCMK